MEKITDIRKVSNANDLIGYFAGKLGWNIDVESFDSLEDISYEFTAADLGLNEGSFAKIRTLRQLRPLDAHQKWGMFCIEFDSAKFEVSALRKVLSGLIPRRRKLPNQPVWNLQDILFLCDWGDAANRTVGVAHFEEREKGLPQIKISACTPSSCMVDPKELRTFEERLSGLAWPESTANWKDWSEAWSKAFTVKYRETIVKSAELTEKLAEEARNIRDRIHEIMAIETSTGYVHLLWDKFRWTLVANMSEKDFADTYAQTMVYGLFSARCMDKTPEDFSVEEAIDCVPSTNPFLKNLMRSCLGVRETGNTVAARLAFDELEIDNVVDLLAHTDMTEIVRDFNRTSGGGKEDPVLYFYEGFAKAYDAEKKISCGEFYTPVPVVNFIVRAVDDILKKDFGYADGLATTATKTVKSVKTVYVKSKKTYVEKTVEEEVPAVQLLDPATGTGTFIRQAILKIHENFLAKHKGTPPDDLREAWNVYVSKQLLPRLNGFELNMASYAVAHMKLAMVLKDTGYDFKGNEQLHVHLTNSLEQPGNDNAQRTFWDDPLAAEAIAANKIKRNNGIGIVIGNPPFAGVSQNTGAKFEWLEKLVDEYKLLNGVDIREQKLRIRNDYIKFLRYGQKIVCDAGKGVLAYINPHAYLDGPTFRAMRWNFMKVYDEVFILNLHGDMKKKERAPDGGVDENVFDIREGVMINIFVKNGTKSVKDLGRVWYADVYGSQSAKYEFLVNKALTDVEWHELTPGPEFYEFLPRDLSSGDEYRLGFSVTDLMKVSSTGVQTSRDELVVDVDKRTLVARIADFCDVRVTDADVRKRYFGGKNGGKYRPGDTRGWKMADARNTIRDFVHSDVIRAYSYRPFDTRYIYYCKAMIDWGREKVFSHFSKNANVGLIISRQGQAVGDMPWNVAFVTEAISDLNMFYRGGGCTFPLYLYTDNIDKVTKTPNLEAKIVAKIEKAVGKTTPEDVFNYVYAVLHTPEYRAKYKEFLKIDFPRIPYPKDAKTFKALVEKGAALVATHLLKSAAVTDDVAASDVAVFATEGANLVEKPMYANGSVKINRGQAFANVPEKAWNFYIGGYQPAQKWLKDRKGRILSAEDIRHYRQIIHALLETDRLMGELSQLSGNWM